MFAPATIIQILSLAFYLQSNHGTLQHSIQPQPNFEYPYKPVIQAKSLQTITQFPPETQRLNRCELFTQTQQRSIATSNPTNKIRNSPHLYNSVQKRIWRCRTPGNSQTKQFETSCSRPLRVIGRRINTSPNNKYHSSYISHHFGASDKNYWRQPPFRGKLLKHNYKSKSISLDRIGPSIYQLNTVLNFKSIDKKLRYNNYYQPINRIIARSATTINHDPDNSHISKTYISDTSIANISQIYINESKTSLLEKLKQRELVYSLTNEIGIDNYLSKGNKTSVGIYFGIDPTASSLHIGHLVPLMILRLLQNQNFKPYIVIGGATAMIGDPSFKFQARKMLPQETIERNTESIKHSLLNILRFDDTPSSAVILNNYDWLSKLNLLDFLKNYGKHFSVLTHLKRDHIRQRIEQHYPLSLLEFSYTSLQAYDFLELFRRYGVRLQIAGSDQWANILSGIDLAKSLHLEELYGLTTPLLTTSGREKMGKSSKGTVWLDMKKTTPQKFWQFWRNIPDEDVTRYLSIFTDLPMEAINKIRHLSGPSINTYKIYLADECSKRIHGVDTLNNIYNTININKKEEGHSYISSSSVFTVTDQQLREGIHFEWLLKSTGIASSHRAAIGLLKTGAIRLNGQVIDLTSPILTYKNYPINEATQNYTHWNNSPLYILNNGKKRFVNIFVL